MKDWLGNEYDVGDLVLYAAGSGRSITMVLARVVELRDNGNVKVQPLKSSRWQQHSARGYYVDTRTGRHIEPWSPSGEHIKSHGFRRDRKTHERLTEKFDHMHNGYYTDAGRKVSYGDWEYVPTEYQPWVEHRYEDAPRPVTLTVTKNIVKWDGELPGDREAA